MRARALVLARRRDERGVYAILFALMSVMLLTLAALGTDLGNAISRHTDAQNQADFAAFDAAQKLTASVRADTTVSDDVLDAVVASFNSNQPQDDNRACWRTQTCVARSDLIDTNADGTRNFANGDVQATAEGLRITAPAARVDFGFANVFGVSGTNVAAQATVNLFSQGPRVLPLFGVSGCDWGRQTLTDPAHVPAAGVPPLADDGDRGPAALDSTALYSPANVLVQSVPKDGSGYVLWVSASAWHKTWKLGFFNADGVGKVVIPGEDLRKTGDHSAWPLPIDDSPATVELTIPTTVTGTEGLWYVRAWGGKNTVGDANNKWSPSDEALPVRIGSDVLECNPDHPGGNFGTLRLPRTDQPSLDVPLNIAAGLEDPLNLVVHPWGVVQHQTNPVAWDGSCDPLVVEQHAVVSEHNTLLVDTNCVDTDPGLTANDATQGFITGVGSVPGLLDAPTKCNRDGGTTSRNITIHHASYSVNDDVLTCFLTGSTSLATITDPLYSGGPALTVDVLKSPRFAWVPILHKDPPTGSSETYSIIDMRPAFITDEAPTAAAVKGSQTGTVDNGLTMDGDQLEQVHLVFFNIDALPREGDFPLIDYLGVGRGVPRLID